MAHSQTVRIINHYASEALKQKDPIVFLQDLGPLHNRWHSTSLRNNLGFLLFHWHVVTGVQEVPCRQSLARWCATVHIGRLDSVRMAVQLVIECEFRRFRFACRVFDCY